MTQLTQNKGRRYTLPVTLSEGAFEFTTSPAFTAYFGVEGALREADGDVVAEGDLIGRAQNFSGGVVGNGVAAVEELERAALIELEGGGFDLSTPARDQRAIDLDAEVARAVVERAAQFADTSAEVECRGIATSSSGEASLLSEWRRARARRAEHPAADECGGATQWRGRANQMRRFWRQHQWCAGANQRAFGEE